MICARCGSKKSEHDCKPIPFFSNEDFVKWRDCPYCKGQGWFIIEPFALPRSHTPCKVCELAHIFYKKNHRNPTLSDLEEAQQ